MISKTPPAVGTVLRYGYLWKREADAAREEGRKDRPVALLLARAPDDECLVLPITHAPPKDPMTAIEIPEAERTRLGLDGDRSWIVLTEFNAFFWPGPDLRPVPGKDPSTVVYGRLSRVFYKRILVRVQTLLKARMVSRVARS